MKDLNGSRFTIRIRNCAKELRRRGISAAGELYDLTAPRIVRYALTVTRNRDDAEDALQAAMVRVALNPNALAEARHPWAYLLKIVRNEALVIAQRRKPAQLMAHVVESAAAPPSEGLSAEMRQTVQMALRKLPPSQSEVVVLKIWEEMTFAEIGEVLGQSPHTAASRYRYALEKLERMLQRYSDEVLHD